MNWMRDWRVCFNGKMIEMLFIWKLKSLRHKDQIIIHSTHAASTCDWLKNWCIIQFPLDSSILLLLRYIRLLSNSEGLNKLEQRKSWKWKFYMHKLNDLNYLHSDVLIIYSRFSLIYIIFFFKFFFPRLAWKPQS